MNAPRPSFWEAVGAIRDADDRLRQEAYGFVVAALDWAVRNLPADRAADPIRRHLSGAEVLAGVAALARREFGAFAPTVFGEWGIRSNEDIGRIVFHLVECGQLSARREDTIQDFLAAPDLLESLASEATPLRASRGDGGEIRPER